MRRFFGALVVLAGIFLLATGAVQFSSPSSGDMVLLAQHVSLSIARVLVFSIVALILGAILLFAS